MSLSLVARCQSPADRPWRRPSLDHRRRFRGASFELVVIRDHAAGIADAISRARPVLPAIQRQQRLCAQDPQANSRRHLASSLAAVLVDVVVGRYEIRAARRHRRRHRWCAVVQGEPPARRRSGSASTVADHSSKLCDVCRRGGRSSSKAAPSPPMMPTMTPADTVRRWR